MTDEERKIVEKVMRDIGLSEEQIALAFSDSPEGREYMAELNRHYALDIGSILRERERIRRMAMMDYENDRATARLEGRAEGMAMGIAEAMRKNGLSEKQIKAILGE